MADNYLIGNVSGDIAHFRTVLEEPLESCKVSFEPIQAGSGDPSPSNVRAISGWNEINIYSTGINVWDETLVIGSVIEDGSIGGASSRRTTSFIPVKGGLKYYFNAPSSAAYGRIAYYDKDKNPIYVDISNGISRGSFTAKDGACYMRITLGHTYGTTYNNDISFNYPSSDTSYHSYKGIISTVLLKEDETLYGGYVDLATGELVETWHSMTLAEIGAIDLGYNSGGYFFATISDKFGAYKKKVGTANVKCNVYKYENASSPSVFTDYSMRGTGGSGAIFWKDSRYTTVSSLVSNEGNNITFCWELDAPIHYQLTPQQINTFKGINNFWSEVGTIDVSYCFKDAPEMLKLRRQIELNSPHVESTIGEIANFKADMAAPLKSCKVSFEPIQAGEGDPSPDNIRAISGRTGLELTHSGVNLLKCDTFTNYTSAGITYTGTRNAEGEIESIRVTGTTTQANCFRNLNYGGGKYFKVFEGGIVTCGYSNQVGVIALGDSGSFYINGKIYTSYNYTDWNRYDIDDQTYNSQHTAKNTATWYRLQTYPYQANVTIDTTVYPMVCLASDAGCAFEPYHGENISVDWQSQAGTVYGGYIDFVTGELVKTWDSVDLGTLGWGLHNNTNTRQAWKAHCSPMELVESNDIVFNAMCQQFKPVTYNSTWVPYIMSGYRGSNYIYVCFPSSTYSSYTDVKAALSGIQAVYKLAEPIRYQLTPQIIRSFKGRNNFWSDAGEVEAKFWTH